MTAPKPRVALVAHAVHDHGGMERAMAELIRAQHDVFRFTVVARDFDPSLRPLVAEWIRIQVPERPAPLRFAAFFVVGGLKIRGRRFDIIHTLGAIIPNRCDVAAVHFCHAGSLEQTGSLAPRDSAWPRRANVGLLHAMALLAERLAYRKQRVRRLLAVSASVARQLERHYPGVPCSVTPNGVDGDRFRPCRQEREVLRSEYEIGPSDVVVLFVGGIWEHKGLPILARAMTIAQRQSSQRLHLWVVGQGDPGRIRGQSDFLRLTFFGRRTDAERFYAAADLLALPSAYEAAPLVGYEAARAELPLIATRVGGIDELIGADQDGGIFVERDERSVGDAIATLANDPRSRVAMGQNARRRAAAYTWERSADAVRGAYEALLLEHGNSGPTRPRAGPSEAPSPRGV